MGYFYIVPMHLFRGAFLVATMTLAVSVQSASAASVVNGGEVSSLARGWGNLDWVALKEGQALAAASEKPLMLVIWKTWCGACKALRPLFSDSAEIASEAANFVVVNTVDDEEPAGAEYSPDGGYIPRILFLSPKGEVMTDPVAQNHAAGAQYRYFHSSPATIVETMKAVSARTAASVLAAAEPPAFEADL